jgi:glyoxylate reductase
MTIGIFGLGRIGSAVARRAKGFNMHIIYHIRHDRNIQVDNELGTKYVNMDELIEQSDFFYLRKRTRGWIFFTNFGYKIRYISHIT